MIFQKSKNQCLVKNINEFLNPVAAIIEHQEKHLRKHQRSSEIKINLPHGTFRILEAS